MIKLNRMNTATGWKRLGAFALAVCTCVATLGFSTTAAPAAARVQSPSDSEEHITLSESKILLPITDDPYPLEVYYENEDYDDYDDEDYDYDDDDEDYDNDDDEDYDDDFDEEYPYDVTWSTSNRSVATVNSDGEVTPVKAGEATITATTENGAAASCKVIVCQVKLNKTQLSMLAGKASSPLQIESHYPKFDKVDYWDSSDEEVAAINEKTGKINPKKAGKTTISVIMESGAEASCKLTVTAPKTENIKFPKKQLTVAKNQKLTLTVKRIPSASADKISWKSSDPKTVKVDKKGVISAKKTGTVTITAKIPNGKKASCKITVKEPRITLKKNSATIKIKKTTKIQVKSTFPKKDKIKSYRSNIPNIASVDNKGKVTAKNKGQAKITVTTKCGAKATFTVNVK